MDGQEYPEFSVGENGLIVSDSDDDFGIVDSDPVEYPSGFDGESGVVDLDPVENPSGLEHSETPSPDEETAGDVPAVDPFLPDPLLLDIQEDIARIVQAQASTEGYLSASALDVFDRVVSGYSYDYYCAFRYDNDSYNAIMYLSDDIENSGSSVVLSDAVSVRLYRVYSSSERSYSYHYMMQDVGDVSVNFADGLMYYTNCVEGYPILGDVSVPGKYPSWVILLCGMAVFCLLAGFFRRKKNV